MSSLKKISLLLAVQFLGSFNVLVVSAFCNNINHNKAIAPTTTTTRLPTAVNSAGGVNRRTLFHSIAWVPIIWSQDIAFAHAKVTIRPDAAFKSLVNAREELQTSKEFLAKNDLEGLREFLSDASLNINRYEENAGALLASKQLDAESKKAIGTIRTYGAGADVIICLGGLKAELEDEDGVNSNSVGKSLRRAMDSLDEVISICRSNGF
mmetsp:Transcript_9374/g.14148  ORF Transcript_9374/g.14148 Transcript_9374/m.14148 type:complete len:209 (-) Transcript_9374:62-688(-)